MSDLLLADPDPTASKALGTVLLVTSLDGLQANARALKTGQPQSTLLHQTAKAGATALGADERAAEGWATVVDVDAQVAMGYKLAMVLPVSGAPQTIEARPSAYSVAFQTQLAPQQFGLGQQQHFEIANIALRTELAENPALAELVPAPTRWGRPPADWTWQHARVEQGNGVPGVLQLVPSNQHTPGSPFWVLFHPLPGGAGGYKERAVPAGAPPR